MKKYKMLMLTTLIISGCSMCYELIISAVSSYLCGDTTLQYSITIGLYMFSMGIGSYLSKYIKKNLFNWFVTVEIIVGLIGGLSALLLFIANIYLQKYEVVMYMQIIAIGILVGAEIPLLTRIIEEDEGNLRVTISSIFSFDYVGGLIGAIAFPILLLPKLGYFSTAFLTGTMNILAALIIVFKYSERIKKSKTFKSISLGVFALMVIGMIFSENISKSVENGLYRDDVILSKQTKYQKIVMTKYKDDIRLFIDGNIQFCSKDEYRYHEAIVHIPMSKAKNKKNVLVLGGGDGLAVRELLKYKDSKVTLVDLDKEMIKICRENKHVTTLNKGALDSKRLKIVTMDAYKYLEKNTKKFDVIIVDLPDPNNETINKLYTNVFYRLCKKSMTEDGIMCVQSTSPYYAPEAFWCINKTLKSEGFKVKPYHLQVPAFGDWGFNLVSKKKLDNDFDLKIDTKYLDSENIKALFSFGKDEKINNKKLEVNSLSKPMLIQYYSEAVANWN